MPVEVYGPERKTIGELLSVTSPLIITSDYQREFSWRQQEAEIFWPDLVSFSEQHPGKQIENREYFLGLIVLIATPSTYMILLRFS